MCNNIKRGKITQYLLCALHIISTQEKSLYLSSSLSYVVALSALSSLQIRTLWLMNVQCKCKNICSCIVRTKLCTLFSRTFFCRRKFKHAHRYWSTIFFSWVRKKTRVILSRNYSSLNAIKFLAKINHV